MLPILECSRCHDLFEGIDAYSAHLRLENRRGLGAKVTGCKEANKRKGLAIRSVKVYRLK